MSKEIYSLRTSSAADSQSDEIVKDILSALKQFLGVVLKSAHYKDTLHNMWSVVLLAKQLLDRLDFATSNSEALTFEWYPEYGCCLLITSADGAADMQEEQLFTLKLLALDKWEFHVHNSYTDSQPTAACLDYKVLGVGSITGPSKLDETMKLFKDLLSKAQQLSGDERSAMHGKKAGHQKTPAFIQSLLKEALAGGERGGSVQGGFTDVGMHTGTRQRGTCWPLVKAFVRFVAQQFVIPRAFVGSADIRGWLHRQQVDLLFSLFHLHQAEVDVKRLIGEGSFSKGTIDNAMVMLTAAARGAAELAAQGMHEHFNWNSVLHRCDAMNCALQRHVQTRVRETAEQKCLQSSDSKHSLGCCVRLQPSSLTRACLSSECSISALRQRALQGLFDVHMFADGSVPNIAASFTKLCSWMEETKSLSKRIAPLLLLSTVERCFFNAASMLDDTIVFAQPNEQLLYSFLQSVESIVSVYGNIIFDMHSAASTLDRVPQPRMRAELRSRELLIVWIAYCLSHASIEATLHTLGSYGVPLDYADLRHLVLSSKPAADAALRVADYLKRYRQSARKLFYLPDQQATLEFVSHNAMSNERWGIRSKLNQERQNENSRIDNYWADVCEQKRDAMRLREQIQEKEAELAAEYWNRNYRRLNRRLNDLRQRLNRELRPPAPVFASLPENDRDAYLILGLLFMPLQYQSLAYFSVAAQQQLLPHRFNFLRESLSIQWRGKRNIL